MVLTKNSQNNPYVLKSLDSIKFMQANYFDTNSNNARSYAQKLEIINLICFLSQKLHKKDPEKYPSCISVLETIFEVNLENDDFPRECYDYSLTAIRSFGLMCDNLLWGTEDDIPKPENITNAKEIKDKIYNYFKNEWTPI